MTQRCDAAAFDDWKHAERTPDVEDRLCAACRSEWQRREANAPTKWTLFAMRKGENLHSFYPSEMQVSMCGRDPIVRVSIELNENGPYWAWLYSFHPHNRSHRGAIAHIYGHVQAVEICFPYGTSPHVRGGHGRIVRVTATEIKEPES